MAVWEHCIDEPQKGEMVSKLMLCAVIDVCVIDVCVCVCECHGHLHACVCEDIEAYCTLISSGDLGIEITII